jgi:hypothetical protein
MPASTCVQLSPFRHQRRGSTSRARNIHGSYRDELSRPLPAQRMVIVNASERRGRRWTRTIACRVNALAEAMVKIVNECVVLYVNTPGGHRR